MLAGLITALVAVVSDQASKALVFGFLAETQPVVAVTPFFNLVSAWNTGVSFSMFDNLGGAGVYILSAFSLVVVGFLLYWLSREKTLLMQVSLGMVIGGGKGTGFCRGGIGAAMLLTGYASARYLIFWTCISVVTTGRHSILPTALSASARY